MALPSRPLKRIGGASAGPAPEPKPLLTPVDASRPRRLSRSRPAPSGAARWAVRVTVMALLLVLAVVVALGAISLLKCEPSASGSRRTRRRSCWTRCCRCCPPACASWTAGTEVELVSVAAAPPSRAALQAAAGVELAGWEELEVPADWRARRALLGGGVLVGDRVLIRSPDDPPPGVPGILDLVVARGGGGFGSGSHPTTRMCLELLLDVAPGTGAAVDLGCGLGTLAIAAARLGWGPVAGVDRMADAVAVARANGKRNGVDGRVGRRRPRARPGPARPARAGERAAAGAGAGREAGATAAGDVDLVIVVRHAPARAARGPAGLRRGRPAPRPRPRGRRLGRRPAGARRCVTTSSTRTARRRPAPPGASRRACSPTGGC